MIQKFYKFYFIYLLILNITLPLNVNAQQADNIASRPLSLIIILAGMSLLPILFVTLTSFAKISIVLSILRNAIGTPQIPPTSIITGLSLILTIYVMSPLWYEIKGQWGDLLNEQREGDLVSKETAQVLVTALEKAKDPYKNFLKKYSSPKNKELFLSLALRSRNQNNMSESISRDDFLVLIPAFIISELSEAFLIGFMIFLPFLIIDLVISNILLALGMHMLSPTTISLPFKLLLFVMVDGWYLISHGLVLSYQ